MTEFHILDFGERLIRRELVNSTPAKFLLVEVEHGKLNVTMNRLQMERGKPNWTRPDTATISVPTVTNAAAAPAN